MLLNTTAFKSSEITILHLFIRFKDMDVFQSHTIHQIGVPNITYHNHGSAETERKFFEFKQNEQVSFRAERVPSKNSSLQFSSRASLSKIFLSGQKLRAKLERA